MAAAAAADAETTYVGLTDQVIDASALVQRVSYPDCGGVATFHGITRNNFKGKRVVHLEYEAYDAMAKKQMAKIAAAIRGRWPGVRGVAMVHRTGVVPVTEASIVICVSSPHRVEALEACHYAIDEVKASVPVWKKEMYEDGSAWKQNSEFLSSALFGGATVEPWWRRPVRLEVQPTVAIAAAVCVCGGIVAYLR
eukprot:TRINITY_DN11224_c0_g1_i1.p2 TRINITY_DN11224_c0_g1~~TRINITY_DN11224_c0_g1_i1.p2  ORF type:complete len:195 (+),score=48.19 TRINITY_DN11224_c0_g1_i1:58-642(+)